MRLSDEDYLLTLVSVVSVVAVPELAPCSWPALSHLFQSPAVSRASSHNARYM